MIQSFDPKANPILSSVIDSIDTSLQCSRYRQIASRIEIYLPGDEVIKVRENKELAEKGFGTCLINSNGFGNWNVFIIINMKNCIKANLTEREIAAVVVHELGHILNVPELKEEPTYEYCFINGIEFKWELLEEVRTANRMAIEIFADSYAIKHGYGKELISTFKKQNKNFEQKIRFCVNRIEKILNHEYLDGKVISTHKIGR